MRVGSWSNRAVTAGASAQGTATLEDSALVIETGSHAPWYLPKGAENIPMKTYTWMSLAASFIIPQTKVFSSS